MPLVALRWICVALILSAIGAPQTGTDSLPQTADVRVWIDRANHTLVATVHAGSKIGAEALVRLLPTGCETMSNPWGPLFRTVLGILEERRWRDLADLRLTEIRGEAYETWWSLSKMPPDDVLVTDAGMKPEDFAEGAPLARERAIRAYEELVKAHLASTDLIHRLAELRAGRDTTMRKWVCYRD